MRVHVFECTRVYVQIANVYHKRYGAMTPGGTVLDQTKRISVVFYATDQGREPVREWLRELSKEDRVVIGTDIMTVEYGWPIGMPVCRSLGGGLWEVRSRISDGRIARVLFCVADSEMYLLTGFIKKTQKTPINELRLARLRRRELGL